MDNNKLIKEYNSTLVLTNYFSSYNIYLYRNSKSKLFYSDSFKFIYVLNGSLNLKLEDSHTMEFKDNSAFFIGPEVAFKLLPKKTTTALILSIDKNYFDKELYERYLKTYLYFFSTKEIEEIKYLLGFLYLENFNKYRSSSECNDILSSLISLINNKKDLSKLSKDISNNDIESSICEITKIIFDNFRKNPNKIKSLDDFANMFNINYYYLSKRFKELIGLNYTEYIVNLKLNLAIKYLLATDKKILEISSLSGFRNSNDLIHQFKKIFDLTPSQFRKNYKDLSKEILNDPIHLESSIQNFLLGIKNYNLNNDIVKNNYAIDVNSDLLLRDIKWNNTIDLNNLIDINKNISIIDKVFSESTFERIIVNISVGGNKVYLVDKNLKLINLNLFEFRFIIEELKKSSAKVSLIFNYNFPNSFNENNIDISSINNILDIISGIVGSSDLSSYTFGLNIVNIKSLLVKNHYNSVFKYIKLFKDILDKKLKSSNLSWILYLNSIELKEDTLLYKDLIEELSTKDLLPNKYLISLEYNHIYPKFDNAIDYFKDLITSMKNYLKNADESNIVIGFSYDLSTIPTDINLTLFYITLFCLELSLIFRSEGYKFAFLNYLLFHEKSNKKLKLYKYTHNPLGIKTLEYYINKIFNSLGPDLIFMNNGTVITKQKEDIFILLYDNFVDYYDYIVPNNHHDINIYTYYDFYLKGLNGKYKIIEYTFDITKNKFDLDDDYMVYISDADKKYLEKNSMPYIDVSFKNIENNLFSYTNNRRLLEIKYIKIQKI